MAGDNPLKGSPNPGRSALSPLLAAACSGTDGAKRDAAFAELLRLVTIFVRAGMGSKLRNSRESVDVCQSVARSFVDDFGMGRLKFENETALAAYLKQVVKHKLAELARADGALKRGGGETPISLASGDGLDPGSDDASASIQAASNEDLSRITAVLSPEEQTLIRLRQGGAEWDVIGKELGKDAAAVRQQFSRLQRKMAELIASRSAG